jgi:hypothetical protein
VFVGEGFVDGVDKTSTMFINRGFFCFGVSESTSNRIGVGLLVEKSKSVDRFIGKPEAAQQRLSRRKVTREAIV